MSIFRVFLRIFLDFSSINDSKKMIWLYLLGFKSFQIFYFRRWNRMKSINDGIYQFLLRFFFRELWSITLKNSFNDRMFCQNFSYFRHFGEKYWKLCRFVVFSSYFLDFSSTNDWKMRWIFSNILFSLVK